MIVKESSYNPLESIFEILSKNYLVNSTDLDNIKKQLFMAGIVPENSDEFNSLLDLLADYHKEYNDGKKIKE